MRAEAASITRFCAFLPSACREIICTRNCSALRKGTFGFLQAWYSLSEKLTIQPRNAPVATSESGLLSRRDVLLRRGHALTKKILLHLLHNSGLIFLACRVQAVFVEQHLAELSPPVPCFTRDVLVDLLAKFGVEGGLVQAG